MIVDIIISATLFIFILVALGFVYLWILWLIVDITDP